jgi:hypothetical protein
MKALLIGNGFTRRYSEKFTYDSLREKIDQYEPINFNEKEMLKDIRIILKDDRYFCGSDFEKAIEYLEFIQEFLEQRTSAESKENYNNLLDGINELFVKYVREANEDLIKELEFDIASRDRLFFDVSSISTKFDSVFTLNFDSLYSFAVNGLNVQSVGFEYADAEYLHYDGAEEFVIGSIGDNKLKIINANDKLNAKFESFKSLKGELHILGCSLSKSDEHLIKSIMNNSKLDKIIFYLFTESFEDEKRLRFEKEYIKYKVFNGEKMDRVIVKPTSTFEQFISETDDYVYKRYLRYVIKPCKEDEVEYYIAINRMTGRPAIVNFDEVYNYKHSVFIPIKNQVKERAIYHILNTMNFNKYSSGYLVQRVDINYLLSAVTKIDLANFNTINISLMDLLDKKVVLFEKKIKALNSYLLQLINYLFKNEIKEYRIQANLGNTQKLNFYYIERYLPIFLEKPVVARTQSKIVLMEKKKGLYRDYYRNTVKKTYLNNLENK